MDAEIVDLASRRKPAPKKPRVLPNGNRFYCMECESDKFLLFETGHVHCTVCLANIGNLAVKVVT